MEDVKVWKSRFSKAKSVRSMWESNLRECYDLFLPDRDAFAGGSKGVNKTRGNERRNKLNDSTGNQSLDQFVNSLKNKLLPSQEKFAQLVPSGVVERAKLNGSITDAQMNEIQIVLDRNTDIMFNCISSSNLDSAILEALGDMAISTGALMIQETQDIVAPFNCVAVPCDQLVIEECNTGSIKNVWREWEIKAEEIGVLWPDHNKEDDKLNKLIENSPTAKVKIIEGTVYDYKEGIYNYTVYTDSSDKKFIYESTYEVSPWIIFRWSKSAGETWGRGPAMAAKPTMSMLNQLQADLRMNNAMAINPPAMVNSKAFTNGRNVKIQPKSKIYVKGDWAGNTQPPVSYLNNGSKLNLGIGMANEYQEQIKEIFYLNNMGGVNAPVRSATEIQLRENQNLEQQTAAYTRLKQELVDPLIQRIYYILSRIGLVDQVTFDGQQVQVKATSPLAQGQDRKDIEAITQYMQTIIGIGGEQGMALAASSLNMGLLPEYLADKFRIPSELRMDEAAKLKQQEAIQQAMTMTEQQQQQPPQG